MILNLLGCATSLRLVHLALRVFNEARKKDSKLLSNIKQTRKVHFHRFTPICQAILCSPHLRAKNRLMGQKEYRKPFLRSRTFLQEVLLVTLLLKQEQCLSLKRRLPFKYHLHMIHYRITKPKIIGLT